MPVTPDVEMHIPEETSQSPLEQHQPKKKNSLSSLQNTRPGAAKSDKTFKLHDTTDM